MITWYHINQVITSVTEFFSVVLSVQGNYKVSDIETHLLETICFSRHIKNQFVNLKTFRFNIVL